MWSDTKEVRSIIDIYHGYEGHHFHMLYIIGVVLSKCDSIDHPTYAPFCYVYLCTNYVFHCKTTVIDTKICYFVVFLSPLYFIFKWFHKMESNLYSIFKHFSGPACKIYCTLSIQVTIVFVCYSYRDIHVWTLSYLESEAALGLFPPFAHLPDRRLK